MVKSTIKVDNRLLIDHRPSECAGNKLATLRARPTSAKTNHRHAYRVGHDLTLNIQHEVSLSP